MNIKPASRVFLCLRFAAAHCRWLHKCFRTSRPTTLRTRHPCCALVILHGRLSRTLHQMARVEPSPMPPALLRFSAPLVFVIGLTIVLLALTRPF